MPRRAESREVSYLHHVTCADLTPAVASGLRSLLDRLTAAGLKRPTTCAYACPPGPRCSGLAFPSARGPRWSKRFP
ncbi:MAG: hypothetical protein ACLR7Z_15500 [Bilophila wadsworthia]